MLSLFLALVYFPIKLCILKTWTLLHINPSKYDNLLLITPSIILTLISLPIVLALIVILLLYKSLVKLILKIRLGDKFVRMITGCNVMACLQATKEPSCVQLVIIVRSKHDANKFYDIVKNKIHEAMRDPNYTQLFSLREKFMDYIYLRKTDLQPEEVVRMVDVGDERELVRFVNERKNAGMVRGDKGCFDLAVGGKVLEERGGYPLIVRVHHCLTDGLSFYNIISQLLCKSTEENVVYANNLTDRVKKSKEVPRKNNILWENVQTVVPTTNENDIFQDYTSDSEAVSSFVTEEEVKYVNVIKRIKSRMAGMSFNAIVLAAFSASLTEYYTKKVPGEKIPEYISVGMPVQIKADRFKNAYNSESLQNFENDFSVVYGHLPIIPKSKKDILMDDYLVDKLIFLKEEFQRIAKSPEILVNYALMKIIVRVAPYTLVDQIYGSGTITTSASCLPGGPKLKMFQGDDILDLVFFTPKQRNMSLGFCCLTYENRLQMSLQTSKRKVKNPETLEAILKGVFRILDVMDKKTKLMYG